MVVGQFLKALFWSIPYWKMEKITGVKFRKPSSHTLRSCTEMSQKTLISCVINNTSEVEVSHTFLVQMYLKKNEFFQPAKPAKWKSIKNSDVLSSTKWLLMKWGRKNNSLNIRSHWYCQHNWNQWVPNSPTQ